jgi:hypothetical protein
MNITLLKRLMDELGITDAEAMSYLDNRTVFTVRLADLLEGDARENHPATGGTNVGAVAGQYSTCQLFNPADSGVLIQVESYQIQRSAGSLSHYVRMHTAALGAPVSQTNWRDSRLLGRPVGQVCALQQVAVAGVISTQHYNNSTFSNVFALHWLLHPGNGIHLQPTVQNDHCLAAWYWREITL